MTKWDKWVIFDMDNTLINTEPLYMAAVDRFVAFMVRLGFDKTLVAKRQAEIDGELLTKMGYSTDRFAESFELTLREFESNRRTGDGDIPVSKAHSEQRVELVRDMAMEVFNQKSVEYDYAAAAVRDIVGQGYKVGVITAGERWVQMKRFDDLSMRNLFHDCWVVLNKDTQVFMDFSLKNSVDRARSWMIGDSIKSDILPAAEAGLNTIHLKTSNWQARDGDSKLPARRVVSIKDLSEAPNVIRAVTQYGWAYAPKESFQI